MKKQLFLILFAIVASTGVYAQQDYIDLGLPSGTIWKSQNEAGHYTYDQAVAKFKNDMPTKEQFVELKKLCTWTWTGKGYEVKGPNGNSIYLPAAGYSNTGGVIGGPGSKGKLSGVGTDGYYWSSTSDAQSFAYELFFFSSSVSVDNYFSSYSSSVRLVKKVEREEPANNIVYEDVDLGLPSGTLWRNHNEAGGFYGYAQAMEEFGDRLPTKEQWAELKTECTWTWTEKGFEVKGPNGNTIFLPADGWRDSGGNIGGAGKEGRYWSSTPYDPSWIWSLDFDSSSKYVYYYSIRNGQSVRLVNK